MRNVHLSGVQADQEVKVTPTELYSAIHIAFRETGRSKGLHPFDIRVLTAISDRGGSANTADLYVDMFEDSTVRGAARRLRDRHLITVEYEGGSGRRAIYSLTEDGWSVVEDWHSRYTELKAA